MSVISEEGQKQLEAILIERKLIDEATLVELKKKAATSHEPFMGLLIKEGKVNNEDLTHAIATVGNMPYVNLSGANVSPKLLSLLPQEVAERHMAVPLGEMQGKLVVAMLDADNVQAVDFLQNKVGRQIKVYMASEEGIKHVISQYETNLKEGLEDALDDSKEKLSEEEAKKKDDKKKPEPNIKTIVQDSPITRALNMILEFAVKNRASDIHIEPLEASLKIRCRIDGVLREIMKLPKSNEPALVSRIKILANLKIDEHRVPQDGEFSIHVAEKDVDLRIAISPVVWGEQVVIRLLDKTGNSFVLEDMGYRGRSLQTIRKGIAKPNGMIITSGPTGSGKSTSLYALVQEIKNDTVNIVTLEDPVEYKMDGVNQIQVNADVGLTFANGLRSILRQDPDIVMVGEIRDKETASLAVQAALTGHLVFSTLHTNSAAGVLPRLLDMGIEPFLIASTVNTVIGQRLVRRIAKDRESYASDHAETESIQQTLGHLLPKTDAEVQAMASAMGYSSLPMAGAPSYTLFQGKDSPDAPGGYKGRLGLYEVFEVSGEIEDLILKRSPTSAIHNKAREMGMITMREDGYFKALAGETTLKEVNRVAAVDNNM